MLTIAKLLVAPAGTADPVDDQYLNRLAGTGITSDNFPILLSLKARASARQSGWSRSS